MSLRESHSPVPTTQTIGASSVDVKVIDCDIHLKNRDENEIVERLPEPYRSRANATRGLFGMGVYEIPVSGAREDAVAPGASIGGTDPDLVDRQLLVEAGVDFAINVPQGPGLMPTPDPDWNTAFASAVNTWQADTWLSAYNWHGRFKGSIAVALDDPSCAAREIETWAGHEHLVQVFVPHYAPLPLGHPVYDVVWEAASRHQLPVAIHVNRGGTDPMLTPVGHIQHFAEYHSIGYSITYIAQLTSLLCSGVFERFPNLKVVLLEGGASWIGPLAWRLDKNFELLRSELPELRQKPSAYLRDHVRFGTQPIEEPDDIADIVAMFELIDAKHLLMFSTDYPHWDYDAPKVISGSRLDDDTKRRILCDNARDLYGLPHSRPVTALDSARAA